MISTSSPINSKRVITPCGFDNEKEGLHEPLKGFPPSEPGMDVIQLAPAR